MIALALACKPQLLLADERTTALDATVQIQILQLQLQLLLLLRELHREMGLSVIFVSHDIGAALEVADRIAVMHAGRIVEVGSARRLIRAPPDLSALPLGCAFAERCTFAVHACRQTQPGLIQRAPATVRAACAPTPVPTPRTLHTLRTSPTLHSSPLEEPAMPLFHDTGRAFMPYPDAPVPHVATGPLSGRPSSTPTRASR